MCKGQSCSFSFRPGDERDDTSKEVAPSSPKDASRAKEQPRHQRLSNLGKAPAHVHVSEKIQVVCVCVAGGGGSDLCVLEEKVNSTISIPGLLR